MSFCTKCGGALSDGAKFCCYCGERVADFFPAAAPAPTVSPFAAKPSAIALYKGEGRVFPFYGTTLEISSGMDAFNHYRKVFKPLAKKQAEGLWKEYNRTVTDLDSFLIEFPTLYGKYRKPMIEAALDILAQAEVFDLSPEQFEDQHTADFCLCGADVDAVIESFNLTIEANQEKKARMYNMMPGVVFHGLGGFAAALALNVAVNKIAESDIRNANVTKKQRAELFSRINAPLLVERAYVDYWRVFLSMTWQMNRRGLDVWYPVAEDNERAAGLFGNLAAGRIPADRIPEQLTVLLGLNPYADDPLKYVYEKAGMTEQTKPIFDYFDFKA